MEERSAFTLTARGACGACGGLVHREPARLYCVMCGRGQDLAPVSPADVEAQRRIDHALRPLSLDGIARYRHRDEPTRQSTRRPITQPVPPEVLIVKRSAPAMRRLPGEEPDAKRSQGTYAVDHSHVRAPAQGWSTRDELLEHAASMRRSALAKQERSSEERIRKTLAGPQTTIQKRYLIGRAIGLTEHQIAEALGKDVESVQKALNRAGERV